MSAIISDTIYVIQCEMYKMYIVSEKSAHQREKHALIAIHRSAESGQ